MAEQPETKQRSQDYQNIVARMIQNYKTTLERSVNAERKAREDLLKVLRVDQETTGMRGYIPSGRSGEREAESPSPSQAVSSSSSSAGRGQPRALPTGGFGAAYRHWADPYASAYRGYDDEYSARRASRDAYDAYYRFGPPRSRQYS